MPTLMSMEEKVQVVESGWSESLSAAGTDESLSYTEYQYPENLRYETLRKHLVSRKIITEGETCEKEYLVALFRKHLLPLPQRNNDLQRLNLDVKAISLNQVCQDNQQSSQKRKRKMESDDESMLSGGSSLNIDESRTVGTNNLTVKMPGGKSDKSSRPVKLKRKSFDTVNKQKLEKSARLDEKEPIISKMMPEIILLSAVSASSTQESSNCYQEERHTPLRKIPESNHEIKENFQGSKRKVRLPSREFDADTGSVYTADGDFNAARYNPVVEVINVHADNEIEPKSPVKACLKNTETIHISIGGGSRRSTVLPKCFDRSEQDKVEHKTEYDENTKDEKPGERSDVKENFEKSSSNNRETYHSKERTHDRRSPDKYRRDSRSDRSRHRSSSRDRNESNHGRSRNDRSRRSPIRSFDRRNGPDFRRRAGNRWIDRGRRGAWYGGRFRGSGTVGVIKRRSIDRARDRARERSRERYRRDRVSSGDEFKSKLEKDVVADKSKKDKLSKETRQKMKEEIKQLDRMIETKRKKERNSESDAIQIIESNDGESCGDVESATINVAIHCCNQSTIESSSLKTFDEGAMNKIEMNDGGEKIQDYHSSDVQPMEDLSNLLYEATKNKSATSVVEDDSVKNDVNVKQPTLEKNIEENVRIEEKDKNDENCDRQSDLETTEKALEDTSSDDDDDDENSSSSEVSDSSDVSVSQKKKKKRKKKKSRKLKKKSESESSETSDESENEKKKRKKKKRKRNKTKKTKKRKKIKTKDELVLINKNLLAELIEKAKEKFREELIANFPQKSDSCDTIPSPVKKKKVEKQEKQRKESKTTKDNTIVENDEPSTECMDAEIDESLLTDDHGYLTGIPLRKEAEDVSERKDSGETTPQVQVDEVFELFKSDDDLDYDLPEEGNWKRKSKHGIEKESSSRAVVRRDGKGERKIEKVNSEKNSKRKTHSNRRDEKENNRRDEKETNRRDEKETNRRDEKETNRRDEKETNRRDEKETNRRDEKETNRRDEKETNRRDEKDRARSKEGKHGRQRSSENNDVRPKSESRDVNNKNSRYSPRMDNASQKKFTNSFHEDNTELKGEIATNVYAADGITIARKVRDEVYKRNDFWKGDKNRSKVTPVADVFTSIGKQGVDGSDQPAGHWTAPYSGIQSKLLQIAGEGKKVDGTRTSCEEAHRGGDENVSTADSSVIKKEAWFTNQGEPRSSLEKYHENSSSSRDEDLKNKSSYSSKRSYENEKEDLRSSTYPTTTLHSKRGKYHEQNNRRESFDRKIDHRKGTVGQHRNGDSKSYDRSTDRKLSSNRWDKERCTNYDERYKSPSNSRTDTKSTKYNDKHQRMTTSERQRYSPDSTERRRLSSGDTREMTNKSRLNKEPSNFRYSHDRKLSMPHLEMDSTEVKSSPSSISNYTRPEKNYRGAKVAK